MVSGFISYFCHLIRSLITRLSHHANTNKTARRKQNQKPDQKFVNLRTKCKSRKSKAVIEKVRESYMDPFTAVFQYREFLVLLFSPVIFFGSPWFV